MSEGPSHVLGRRLAGHSLPAHPQNVIGHTITFCDPDGYMKSSRITAIDVDPITGLSLQIENGAFRGMTIKKVVPVGDTQAVIHMELAPRITVEYDILEKHGGEQCDRS